MVFLPLTFIIDQFTLIFKLTIQNEIGLTQIILLFVCDIKTTHVG